VNVIFSILRILCVWNYLVMLLPFVCLFFFYLKKKKKKNPKKGYTLVLLYREHGKHTHMDHRIRGVSSAIISRLTRVIKEDESPSTPW